ncbi:small integral membrane protein 13 [Gadus chalcogrammus]|uniref:small integral membrane protein 13 n=1 Tax=Gadus chalcogrammus TaxID=1042646 RepID=UPI0024C495DF|nr:small integral membrane protein 13 [Gadus chalcogrammus]
MAAEMWQSVGLTVLVIVATLVCVLLFMLFGWYVVWQLFLSKFKFLRELLGEAGTPQAETQPAGPPAERSAAAPTRSRPRSSRQRVTPTEPAS